MSSSLLGISKEGEEFYVLNVTENYRARLVNWFGSVEERIASSLKAGNSVALIGPHGVGKSVLARYVAARLVGEFYAVIDLGVDVVTFDSLLEMLHEVPHAVGFYDPLGITFYDNPMVPRAELASLWMEKCSSVLDRALYLTTRDVPTLLVLPYSLYQFSPCRDRVEKTMRVIDFGEYLRHVDVAAVAQAVFVSHSSALGCKSPQAGPYIEYVLSRHGDFSGVLPLAVYGAKIYARNRCARLAPEDLYKKALEELSLLYYQLYKTLFFPTCGKSCEVAPALWLSLRGEHLPAEVARLLPHAQQISRRLSILNKITLTTDLAKLIREEVLEELRELYDAGEADLSIKWASSPKESVVTEALKITLRRDACASHVENVTSHIRTIYRGLLTLRPELVVKFAEALANVATGRFGFCSEEVGNYLCHGEATTPVILEALSQGRRLTLEFPSALPQGCTDDADVLVVLALQDARRASMQCVEKFAETLYGQARARQDALSIFYKLFRDYVEVAVERGSPRTLRLIALAHYVSKPPREAAAVLRDLVSFAVSYSDYKTAEIALASLAKILPEEALAALPSCDCPYLHVVSRLHIARSYYEAGKALEAVKILEDLLNDIYAKDPRFEYTQSLVEEIEELYKEAALEGITI
ncbi:MAG: ATP-binding protein [Pyrobaculum sp.]